MANWRITFPIEKAEKRDDGYYLTGLASGPEIDATDERMSADLILRYADQINATTGLTLDDRLVYRDAHMPDGVMRDLGWVTKAFVNEEQRLSIDVKLDDENPAAMYLFRQVNDRKKKYGMSVAGKVLDYVDEWVTEVGKTIRTYKDVILTEISNTTRPAWTPSFGSVLAKAISDATSVTTGSDTPAEADVAPQGELMPAEEIQNDAQKSEDVTVEDTAIEATAEEPTTTEVVEESAEADTEKSLWDAASMAWTLGDVVSLIGYTSSDHVDSLRNAANSLLEFISSEVSTTAKAAYDAAKSAADEAPAAEAVAEVVEDAPPAEEVPAEEPVAEKDAPDLVAILSKALGDALRDAGVIKSVTPEAAAQADSQDDAENPAPVAETPVEETTLKAETSREELERSVAELTAKVAELESSAPTVLPPAVERSHVDSDDFRKALDELPRDRRLAAAFAAKTGGR